jgi:hypothetical protein
MAAMDDGLYRIQTLLEPLPSFHVPGPAGFYVSEKSVITKNSTVGFIKV